MRTSVGPFDKALEGDRRRVVEALIAALEDRLESEIIRAGCEKGGVGSQGNGGDTGQGGGYSTGGQSQNRTGTSGSGLDAIVREDGSGAIDLLQARGFATAGSRIEDQQGVLNLCRARRRIGLRWLVRGGGSGERVKATRIV